jgi:uncharacterized membrane protein YdfJ with MMPL/SSD domain
VEVGGNTASNISFDEAVYGKVLAGATGSVKGLVPIVIFAFLFGLSMDYEVFVLSRIGEEYDRTGSTNEAIVQAMAKTSPAEAVNADRP